MKSLRLDNEFRFICPILGSEERLADCFQIEIDWMRGKPTRGAEACNACMASGKCPTWHISQVMRKTDAVDAYWSAEPKLGVLQPDILKRIKPVMVQQNHITQYGVDPDEAKILLGSSTYVAVGEETSTPKETRKRVSRGAVAPSKPVASGLSAIESAAASGDMSAALNEAMKTVSEPVAPKITRPAAPPAPVASSPELRPMSLLERARLAKEQRTAA